MQELRRLVEEGDTCALRKGESLYRSRKRGILPLIEWIDSGIDLTGALAADRVVGRAAALLYAHMGISALYAAVLSVGARDVLTRWGIAVECGVLTPAIINRAGDGPCPMESAVAAITDPMDAPAAVRAQLAALQQKKADA